MARSRRLSELAQLVIGAAEAAAGEPPGSGRPLIVATSGGADSAAALWACAQIADVCALHVDHGWPYSNVLGAAAAGVASQVGVPLIEESIEVGASEASARSGRYEAFGRHLGDGLIVTGHSADDLAETVVANLARGAGLHGLQGIPFERPGFVRPFLGIRRDELRELAALVGLSTIDDPANADPAYTRVRLRSMLRGWEVAMGRQIVPSIVRGAGLAAEESRFVEERSRRIEVRTDGSVVAIDLATLVTAPAPLARKAIRRALRHLDGVYAGTLADVDASLRVATGGPPEHVGGRIVVRRVGERLEMVRLPQPGPVAPAPVEIQGDGVHRFGRWSFTFDSALSLPVTLAASRRSEVFDASVAEGAMILRSIGPDDRLALGGTGSKSAVEALSEHGVSESERIGWPILVSSTHGPLWVPGVRRSSLGWVTEATERYLVVSASQEERWTPVEY